MAARYYAVLPGRTGDLKKTISCFRDPWVWSAGYSSMVSLSGCTDMSAKAAYLGEEMPASVLQQHRTGQLTCKTHVIVHAVSSVWRSICAMGHQHEHELCD